MAQTFPAIFLDRDGTINIDSGYVYDSDDFQFIEGVIETCRKLKEMGFLLVIITNQSGIARGKYSEEQFIKLTEWMDWSFADKGVEIDAIYYCPHHPTEGHAPYRQQCSCRKPAPGMILTAQKELGIDLSASYIVGDKIDDLQAGRAAGVGKKILVRTGKPVDEHIEKQADFILNSLNELPMLIRNQHK